MYVTIEMFEVLADRFHDVMNLKRRKKIVPIGSVAPIQQRLRNHLVIPTWDQFA
jgi:hypothetical protein